MAKLTDPGIGRMVAAWAGFLIGLALLLWLHTFRDNIVHQAIGPLFLLLWVLLLAYVWEGCKAATPRLRHVLFATQVAASVVVCVLFFRHLISQSL